MGNYKKFFLVLFLLGVFCAPALALDEVAYYPKIEATYNTYPENPLTGIQSAVSPIQITNPYAAAGQPVIIEFTLKNIGQDYPYNTIPLAPNSYVLVMSTDKDLGVVLPNGKELDIWERMNWAEQFGFLIQMGTAQFTTKTGDVFTGRLCSSVDVWAALPKHIQTWIIEQNDGKKPNGILTWDCIKVVDLPFFQNKLKPLLNGETLDWDNIQNWNDPALLGSVGGQLNQSLSRAVSSTIVVALTNDVPRGDCVRPYDNKDLFGMIGDLSTGNYNLVKCGIGDKGLQPGDSVTFRFVGIVPVDTPVVPPARIEDISELQAGVIQKASCLDSSLPQYCHTIYAAVYPAAQDNLFRVLWRSPITNVVAAAVTLPIGGVGALLPTEFAVNTLGGVFTGLFNVTDFIGDFDSYFRTHGGTSATPVGEPIWEGVGIFYVLGAQLDATINLIIWAAFVAGAFSNLTYSRKFGGG